MSDATSMDVATRNRAIKKLLEAQYGRGNVSVRGSRGTAYGWVNIEIDAPKPDNPYSEYSAEIEEMIAAAGLRLDTYYGYGPLQHGALQPKMHVWFIEKGVGNAAA
jgi:hypothetical protein